PTGGAGIPPSGSGTTGAPVTGVGETVALPTEAPPCTSIDGAETVPLPVAVNAVLLLDATSMLQAARRIALPLRVNAPAAAGSSTCRQVKPFPRRATARACSPAELAPMIRIKNVGTCWAMMTSTALESAVE